MTLTAVGYGDISPKTPLGQAIASMVMITGYAIIARTDRDFTAELTFGLCGRNFSQFLAQIVVNLGMQLMLNFVTAVVHDLHV